LGVYILQAIGGACRAENVGDMWKPYFQELHQDTTDNKYCEIFYEKVSVYNKTVADMPLLTIDTFS